jgi:hypothetical protein
MKSIAVSLVALFAALPALAQTTPPATPTMAAPAPAAATVHIRGTIASLKGNQMTVKEVDGSSVTVTLADDVKVRGVIKAKLSEIKPGTFIGTAEVDLGNDKGKSLEVVVFPEAARGMGEGHYDWDLKPGSTMTNGTVGTIVEGSKDRELEVAFKGGTRHISVPKTAPIVTFTEADKADLKRGAHVFFSAPKEPGDAIKGLAVGKNGVVPPM